MVEVRLETSDWEKYVRDHYISVRVGESQKLAKMSACRNYKFPASAIGSRKYGKIEIFQRVGSGTICIDPALAAGENEVDVVFDSSTLRFTAQVSQIDSSAKEEKKPQSPTASAHTKAQRKAMDYLDEHHLEVRLADAMQAVLRERPADPAAFIAERLTKNSSLAAKLPVPPKDVKEEPEAPPGAAKGAPATSPAPSPPSMAQFTQYYVANFQGVGAGSLSGLYAKFGGRSAAKPTPAPAVAPAAAGKRFFPSTGSYHGPAFFGGIKPFKPSPPPAPPAPPRQFSKMPSVGTWLVLRREGDMEATVRPMDTIFSYPSTLAHRAGRI